MKEIDRVFAGGRRTLLAVGLALLSGGCGGEQGGTSPEVAKAQEEASAAWAKEKADHPKSTRVTGKASNQTASGGRGYINKPG